jgi:hypothetical protein
MQQPHGGLMAELGRRLGAAGDAFTRLRGKFLSDQSIALSARMQVYKAAVVPILIYGAAESWAPSAAQLARLDTFNTSCLRRILGISRLARLTNEELYAASGQPAISDLLRTHRLRWLGHVARQPATAPTQQLLHAHFIPGRQPRDGQAPSWLRLARADVAARGMREPDWWEVAQHREAWAASTAQRDS